MRTAITLIVTLLFSFTCYKSVACSCKGDGTVQDEIRYSDAVVVGTILKKELVTLRDSTMYKLFLKDSTYKKLPVSEHTIARYDLLVESYYKGEISKDTIGIYTGLGGGDCGKVFEVGKKYIVYGKMETYFGRLRNNLPFPEGKNVFWTNICTRTGIYSRQKTDEIERFTGNKKKPSGH